LKDITKNIFLKSIKEQRHNIF